MEAAPIGLMEDGGAVALVPYDVLGRFAMGGRAEMVEAARRFEIRLLEGVGGVSFSSMAGDTPLLLAALLVARVERLEDIVFGMGSEG
jgi:hypothetical protein